MSFKVAALYQFVDLPDFQDLQAPLFDLAKDCDLKGTLLLAEEGINGTVAGPEAGIDRFIAEIINGPLFGGRLDNLELKYSYASKHPFLRMKVRLKKEIVALGRPDVNPNRQVGQYVEPEDWNALIADPDTVVIDTRNVYETRIGTFKNAIDPGTTNFRDFPAYVEQNLDNVKNAKVAMFCTGGIRCEKATAYMLEQGFKEVYHLKGGILKYLETVPQEESLWEGDCFVFDERVAVGHGLKEGEYDMCRACRMPLTLEETQSEEFIPGVQCPHCKDDLPEETRARAIERQKQIDLAKQRGEPHIGDAAHKFYEDQAKLEAERRAQRALEKEKEENLS